MDDQLESLFQKQKQFSIQLRKGLLGERTAARIECLKALERTIVRSIPQIVEALAKDFRKPEAETLVAEVLPVLEELRFTKAHLKKWAQPSRVRTPVTLMGTKSYLIPEPRGVCLIIGPWNYPFQLVMMPLISAVAAGNCAILKPSELTPHTSALILKMVSSTFQDHHVKVIEGGVDLTQQLLRQPFDHIFFTGSTPVGRIVMEAASRHLSSLTLELGGKSPVIVDRTANLDIAAEKVVWGKFLNAGQTCIAPDTLFVHREIMVDFRKRLIEKIETFYGATSAERRVSQDYARILSVRHTERLARILQEAVAGKAEIVYGGEVSVQERYVSPTLIEKVGMDSSLMNEEIFGPLLPIIPFEKEEDVISFVNNRPKPLALYIYSQNEVLIQKILIETSSGGACVNDNILHVANHYLPFGGIGASGMGNYHGHWGFKTFSHEKALLRQTWLGRFYRLLYPPYTGFKQNLFKMLIRWKSRGM